MTQAGQPIDIADLVGPYTWGAIHYLVENFPCAPCVPTGSRLFRGIHDLFNYHVGNPIQFPEDLEFLRETIQGVPIQPTAAHGLEAEVARLAVQAGLLKFPTCSTKEAQKHEKCVIATKGKVDSPHAVCTVSVGCTPSRSRR